MISIENFVFDTFYNQLIQMYPDASITNGYDAENATFPSVVLRETGNVAYRNSATDDCAENHARLTYEVEVTSNKEGTARSECRDLLNAADEIMQGMKFFRTYKSRPFNMNRTMYSQSARYEGIVGKPVEINGNTVYQMYRR